MKNWYCRPSSEAEAIEIVERAVANGAVERDVVSVMAIDGYKYKWNVFSFWGVHDGKTITFGATQSAGEQLTIQQVREQFPLPHEVKVMSDKKEWQGPQDGLPPVGTVCSVFHRAKSETLPSLKICRIIELLPNRKIDDRTIASEAAIYLIDGETFREVGIAGADSFSTIRTERDKWIEYVTGLVKPGAQTDESLAGAIYDALKSGALKAPEV